MSINSASSNKSPFIEGFKEPTLSKNSFITLADVRGDGEGKLVIWSDEQSQIIVYKGSNREVEKPSKIKNSSGIIQYFDEERNPKAVIAISAENGLYIFRSLNESFRLRIPDIIAQEEEQLLWSQFQDDPERLTQSLQNGLPKKLLSETARHFLSASTLERKQQLIRKVFTDGINEKDSISSMTCMRESDSSVGNIILGTELSRIYILDVFGHSIIDERVVDKVPAILLAYGNYVEHYIIISIDREGEMSIFLKSDKENPSQKIKLSGRVISATLHYPDLLVCTQNQVILHYLITKNSSKLNTQKYSFKLAKQPIKVLMFQHSKTTSASNAVKISIVLFQDELRLYNEKNLIYTFYPPNTQYKMYDVLFGSFAKEQNCLIIMYENHGFEVQILHRQFNPKLTYGSNKQSVEESRDIQIPKKTSEFKSYWNKEPEPKEAQLSYKLYQKNLKLLKWMTYKEKFTQKIDGATSLRVNSKILGLGPEFIVKLQIENSSNSLIKDVKLIPIYDENSVQITKGQKSISMLSPNTQYSVDLKVTSLSLKNQSINFELYYESSSVQSVAHLPNCEQFADM